MALIIKEKEIKYEVEALLKKCIKDSKKKRVVEFLVKWKSYDKLTWEPEKNLMNVPDLLLEFERRISLSVVEKL